MYRKRCFKQTNFEALGIIEPVAEKYQLSLREIVFRWLVHHSKLRVLGGNDSVVLGLGSMKQ